MSEADIVRQEARKAATPPVTPAPPVLTTPPAARPVVTGLAHATSEPVLANDATIRRWAADRGINDDYLDMPRINALRRRHMLPAFERETFQRTARS